MLGFKRKEMGEARYKALVEKHCIQCQSFKGGDDSSPLTDLLEKVRTQLEPELLKRQSDFLQKKPPTVFSFVLTIASYSRNREKGSWSATPAKTLT